MAIGAGVLLLVRFFRHDPSGAERDRDQPNHGGRQQEAGATMGCLWAEHGCGVRP